MPLYPLTTLLNELRVDVPARNGIPNDEQYRRAIADAILDYCGRCPVKREDILSVVDGVASYPLPNDYFSRLRFSPLTDGQGVIQAEDGLIPVTPDFEERYQVVDEMVVFSPTPVYSATRRFTYQALFLLDENEAYTMPALAKRLVMLKAQAICLRMQTNKAVQEAWSYAMGSEKVDKNKLAPEIRNQAKALEDEYMAGVMAQLGTVSIGSASGRRPVGRRANYDGMVL